MELYTLKMKHIAWRLSSLIAILLITVQVGFAQSQTVTGVVLDENSNPIIGANVIVQGTTSGVTTGLNGDFVIKVDPNSVLEFSYIGYRTIEETVSSARTSMEVILNPSAVDLDEVIVVGYSAQSRVSVMGSVASVKAEELETVASTDIKTALTGQMPGVTVVQNSGWAGEDTATITIRGVSSDGDNSPLVLVDGFERDLNDVDMSEVESISVLKDASATAVYGVKGANGVIIVTTKRGEIGEKIKFTFKAEGGLRLPSFSTPALNTIQYAELFNEAVYNDNQNSYNYVGEIEDVGFSDEEIQLYKDGTNIAYPNIDYRDLLFNKTGYTQKYSLSMSGGNERVRYYNSVSYNYQKDALKNLGKGYDASSWYDKVNVRSNVEAKLTPTTTLKFNMATQFTTTNRPNVSTYMVQYNMTRDVPGMTAGFIDGKPTRVLTSLTGDGYFSRNTAGTEILSQLYDTGYNKTRANKIQTTFNISQDLSSITKGLTADVYFTYDNSNTKTFTYNSNCEYYDLTSLDPVTLTSRTSLTATTPSLSRTMGDIDKRVRAQINYNRKFNDHNFSALAVFNATDKLESSTTNGDYDVPYRTIEIAAKGSYSYKSRYFVDVNLGISGSENFHPDNRYGFFPAASAGWVLSNENFFPKNNILSFVKFKGSYGLTGNDGTSSVGSRFYYNSVYSIDYDSGYLFGGEAAGAAQGTSSEGRAENVNLTWETNYQTNIGISTQWFNNRLILDAEVYRNDRKDILMEPTNLSNLLGLSELSYVNTKELRAQGYEISVNWSDNIGKFSYSIGGNFSFYENKIMDMGELDPTYEWQRQTGLSISQYYGFEYDGLYTQAEIDQLVANNYVGTADLPTGYGLTTGLQAGDVKYKDLDGDGTITANDNKYFEATTVPPISFSVNMSLNYKQWGMSMMWQGTSGGYYEYSSHHRVPFQNYKNGMTALALERWTEETADTAKYPRLTTAGLPTHSNYQDSDLWLSDSDYIRLKTMEISYKWSTQSLKKVGFSSMRLYATGYNLLTFTGLKHCDPETTSGLSVSIPPATAYSLGVQISF